MELLDLDRNHGEPHDAFDRRLHQDSRIAVIVRARLAAAEPTVPEPIYRIIDDLIDVVEDIVIHGL